MFAINRKSDFARKLEQDIQYIRLEMLMHSRAGIVHPSHENESLKGRVTLKGVEEFSRLVYQ